MGCVSSNTAKSKSTKNTSMRFNQGVTQLRQNYDINPKLLGTGSFGKVFMATNKSDSSHRVAIKVLNKSKLTPDEIREI